MNKNLMLNISCSNCKKINIENYEDYENNEYCQSKICKIVFVNRFFKINYYSNKITDVEKYIIKSNMNLKHKHNILKMINVNRWKYKSRIQLYIKHNKNKYFICHSIRKYIIYLLHKKMSKNYIFNDIVQILPNIKQHKLRLLIKRLKNKNYNYTKNNRKKRKKINFSTKLVGK